MNSIKTVIAIETIRLPHGDGGHVSLQLGSLEAASIYEGSAECADAIYKVLKELQDKQVDLSTTEIMMSETRS